MLDDAALRILALVHAVPGALMPLLARQPMPDDPDVVLLHPRRSAIFQLTEKEPGLSVTEISERLTYPYGETYRHIEKLEAAGLVVRRGEKPTRVFPTAEAPSDAPALSTDTARAIAALLLEKPGLSSREIAEHTGAGRSTVVQRLRVMMDAKLVRQELTWDAPIYHPTPKLEREISRK